MNRRWDDDERGHGVADAQQQVAGALELVAAFDEPDWVAEDPELHLKPHVDAWCEADGRLELTRAYSDDHGALVLDLNWRGEPAGPGAVRAAVYALIGQFAESATYVRQRRSATGGQGPTRFEVGTGELDGVFASHGHAVVINIASPGSPRRGGVAQLAQ
ncbi:MAG: hypothetical protein ACXVHJ_07345 [Solirubrobacteraceae bacterium]